jgi:hypothetical protein
VPSTVHSAVLPEGQRVDGQFWPLHATSHRHESLQSTLLHALGALQSTVHGPSPQSIEEHAFVVQVIAHAAASRQSIDEHASGLVHEIVHAKPLGHSTELQSLSPPQSIRQVSLSRLQPALQMLGQSSSKTQNPSWHVRPSLQSAVTEHAKSLDRASTRQLASAPIAAASRNRVTGAPSP